MNSLVKTNDYNYGTPLARLWNYSDFLSSWRDYDIFFDSLSQNIRETENETNYILEFDIPGFSKEEVNIEVENNNLVVTAHSKSNKGRKDAYYSLYVDTYSYDTENITSSLQNGVLTVNLPKTAKSQKRKIEVTV